MKGACFALVLVAAVAAQPAAPQLSIVTPAEGDYVSGPILIVAYISGAKPTGMTFYADGRVACHVYVPPWQCGWDAGDTVVEHSLRVVADLEGGKRLIATRRTKPLDYAEAADVEAVLVPVSVRKDGRFVKGLKRDDFRVKEDGKAQDITFFAAEGLSLEVLVAMDVSGSMADDMVEMRAAVKDFLASLRPQDQSIIAGFNTSFFVVSNRGASPDTRLRAIDRLAAWGGTAAFDALVRSADMLQRRPGRKAIVLFSDGDDNTSRTSMESAIRRMESSDAILYAIAQGHAMQTPRLRSVLDRLSRISGGRAFFTDDITELRRVFAEIVEDLANQYALGYTPERPPDSSWRKIEVDVRGKYDVRARQGYRPYRRPSK